MFSLLIYLYEEHQLALQPVSDGLIHRPKADWNILYVNTELNETDIWLQSAQSQDPAIVSHNNIYQFPLTKLFSQVQTLFSL